MGGREGKGRSGREGREGVSERKGREKRGWERKYMGVIRWRNEGRELVSLSLLSSRRMRSLALVAHFSPLISGCGNHTHFMDKAPVVQVPWSEVAIHVLQEQVIHPLLWGHVQADNLSPFSRSPHDCMQVPHSDMLYAMKGSYIALGRVDPSEVGSEA